MGGLHGSARIGMVRVLMSAGYSHSSLFVAAHRTHSYCPSPPPHSIHSVIRTGCILHPSLLPWES